jgi:hypothetical protein
MNHAIVVKILAATAGSLFYKNFILHNFICFFFHSATTKRKREKIAVNSSDVVNAKSIKMISFSEKKKLI